MTVTIKNGFTLLGICLGLLIILIGCSSQKTTTATQDQSSLPSQEQKGSSASVAEAMSKPMEEVRVTETGVPPESTRKPSSGVSEQQEVSPVLASPSSQADSLGDAFFAYDRFALGNDTRATIEANARLLRIRKSVKVLIEGYCDERGTAAYNLILGEKRAKAAKRYLQDLGVASLDIQVTSYGKERPFCTEHREACWQQNRRAHFVVR